VTANRETVLSIVEKSRFTWDFATSSADLQEAITAIRDDATLLDVSKRPLLNLLTAAATALDERSRSPEHLSEALSAVQTRVLDLTEEEAQHLTAWFFRVVYSGGAVTFETIQRARPVIARVQGDPGFNKKKLSSDLEKYRRLADWGTDLPLSERNLRGLLTATTVLNLPRGFGDEARARAEEVLKIVAFRKNLNLSELSSDALRKCRSIVEQVWKRFESDGQSYLPQEDTVALHICLNGLSQFVARSEELAGVAHELTEEIDGVRARFQQVRYPSSTTILLRTKAEIDALDNAVGTSIDFDALLGALTELEKRINRSRHGTRGVNWMHTDHVNEAMAAVSLVRERINEKLHDPAALEAEIGAVEAAISELDQPTVRLAAGQLKRLVARVKRDAPLTNWVARCFPTGSGRDKYFQCIEAQRNRLQTLWHRMEGQQAERLRDFDRQCADLKTELAGATDLRHILDEIREVASAREDFTRESQAELNAMVDGLFAAFKTRVCDIQAVRVLLDGVRRDVKDAHRHILARIDFDNLNEQIAMAKRWVGLRDFPDSQRPALRTQINECYGQVRKLRFRQEAAKAERLERAEQIFTDLKGDIEAVVSNCAVNAKAPDVWQRLVDLDQRLRDNARLLSEPQLAALRESLDSGFNCVRAARAAFAAQAAQVFAQYNEDLSNVLFTLEEDPTRESAFEAIERIKPVRANLKTEGRLLRAQRQELNGLLSAISASIHEIFEQSDQQATREYNRIQADIERLATEVQGAQSWGAANSLIDVHQDLSAQVRDAQLNIASRKMCRAELDKVWEELEDRLRLLRAKRDGGEDLEAMLDGLERQGFLIVVNDVPTA
jgi:hypothetical protein